MLPRALTSRSALLVIACLVGLALVWRIVSVPGVWASNSGAGIHSFAHRWGLPIAAGRNPAPEEVCSSPEAMNRIRTEAVARIRRIQARLSDPALNPHPHYLAAYRDAEMTYWAWELPAWIAHHYCELAAAGVPVQSHMDVGIAYGTLAAYTREVTAGASAIVGVDWWVEYMSKAAQAELGVQYVFMDIERSPLPAWTAGGMDAVLLTEVLEHMNYDPVATLSKIRRALKPHGVLFVSTPRGPGSGVLGGNKAYARWEELPPATSNVTARDAHVYEYSLEELADVAQRAGFYVDCLQYNSGPDGSGSVPPHDIAMLRASPRVHARTRGGEATKHEPVCKRQQGAFCQCLV